MRGQAVIDLLIPGQSPGIKEKIVDLYGKPEILFFGPDGRQRCALFPCDISDLGF